VFLATVLGLVGLLELLVAEDEVEVFVESLILHPLDRTLPELLETVHLAGVTQRTTAVRLLLHLLHLLREVEVDRQDGLLELLRNETPPLQVILRLRRWDLTITFLLYSLK
jgi:hypothetical protein